MAVIRMPRMFGGGPRVDPQPAPGWDHEMEAMRHIGEWLGQLNESEQLRVLAYFMWRLKSNERPHLQDWVESVAEQAAVDVSKRHGFKESVE